MLGFFESKPVNHATLGELTRRRGWWTGTIDLPQFGAVELRVAGDRHAPDAQSLARAASLPRVIGGLETDIARELYEHYLAGLEEVSSTGFPGIDDANAVWPHVRCERIAVDAANRSYTVEIACAVAWDDEHTLGVRLNDNRVVELNGSIL